jgi:hypothetical protein
MNALRMPLPAALGLLAAAALCGALSLRFMSGAPGAAQGSPRSATFQIEGQPVTLVEGLSETPAAPGSASRIVTRYAGTEATGDLDGDGRQDSAFLIRQSRGGSGTFYYVVAAVSRDGAYSGTNAVLLGDRIAPQSLSVSNGALVVTYAGRAPGAAMTTPPSIGMSKTLRLIGGTLGD